MRFTFVLLLAGVASASLYSRQNIPTCAVTCIGQADLGDCSATDNVCLCNNQQFVDSTAACIQSTCTGDDLTDAIAFAQATCEGAGVTLDTTATESATGTDATATDASATTTGTATGTTTAASEETDNAAKQNSVPALAAAALGLAAFIL